MKGRVCVGGIRDKVKEKPTGFQSRGHSICTAEQLPQKTGAIKRACTVLHDCITLTVPTDSERSGLTYFQKAQTKLHLGLIGNTYNLSE